MATKGFTKIDNSILFDLDLSTEAIVLYAKLQYFSSMKNFKINREHMKSVSGYGETVFRRAWKELKDKGLLIQNKTRNKGRYEYIYTLKTNELNVTTKEEKKAQKSVDSDGNAPLEGQVTINEVEQVENEAPKGDEITTENIMAVEEVTGLNSIESLELLKIAKNNVTKVIECYKYALRQKGVKNIVAYTKACIAKNINIPNKDYEDNAKVLMFNSYNQRQYDYDALERALLYGEDYQLPV